MVPVGAVVKGTVRPAGGAVRLQPLHPPAHLIVAVDLPILPAQDQNGLGVDVLVGENDDLRRPIIVQIGHGKLLRIGVRRVIPNQLVDLREVILPAV